MLLELLTDPLEKDKLPLLTTTNEEERLRAYRLLLINRIEELMQRDVEKLKWILYRIDVNEKKLKEALEQSGSKVATLLADMIIKRQLEKAESRKKFGEQENDWNFDV